MQICQKHWNMMKASIELHGMYDLIAKSSEEAMANTQAELKGEKPPFDPLMSMNWFWMNQALEYGGLYLMGVQEDGTQYCPLCEFEKHAPNFNVDVEIDKVSTDMREYCIKENLIPKSN